MFNYVISSVKDWLEIQFLRQRVCASWCAEAFSYPFLLVKPLHKGAVVLSVELLDGVVVADYNFRVVVVRHLYVAYLRHDLFELLGPAFFEVRVYVFVALFLFALDLLPK